MRRHTGRRGGQPDAPTPPSDAHSFTELIQGLLDSFEEPTPAPHDMASEPIPDSSQAKAEVPAAFQRACSRRAMECSCLCLPPRTAPLCCAQIWRMMPPPSNA